MVHPRTQTVTVDQLVEQAAFVAILRPDDPNFRTVPVRSPEGPPDAPPLPVVAYDLVYERWIVEEWLRPPPDAPPAIETPSPRNEDNARTAHDAAFGMLGRVHRVVLDWSLDDPTWSAAVRTGPRIAFLASAHEGVYSECAGGLGLPVEARGAVLERLRRPPRPWWRLWG